MITNHKSQGTAFNGKRFINGHQVYTANRCVDEKAIQMVRAYAPSWSGKIEYWKL